MHRYSVHLEQHQQVEAFLLHRPHLLSFLACAYEELLGLFADTFVIIRLDLVGDRLYVVISTERESDLDVRLDAFMASYVAAAVRDIERVRFDVVPN